MIIKKNPSNNFLRCWIRISFLNLFLVAVLGLILRYKIAFYLPFVDQKFFLHSHSHFAFSGWVTQTLMVLLIHTLSLNIGAQTLKKYRWLLIANLLTAYGMLISFMFQGYAFFSISFSVFSILVSWFFAFYYWRDLNRIKDKKVSFYWFKAALALNILSSLGTFFLSYMMINKEIDQNWYLASIYFYLHFQYNGWFFFAGMGLLLSKFEIINSIRKNLVIIFILFGFASIPTYFLSILWIPFSIIITILIVIAVVAQLVGLILLIRLFINEKAFITQQFSKYGRILLLLSLIALSIKLLLQTGSLHPALSQLSYGFRPIIVGYLHLVLLAVTSVFIIGYILSFNLITVTKKLLIGVFIFIVGIIINELLLMVQGIAALNYTSIPYINIFLLVAALLLVIGTGLIFLNLLKSKENC
jgi:hypothetical protein